MSGDVERMRVSTAEREASAQILGSAMAEGRLTLAEYEQRLDLVWNSSTRGELAKLTDDLPAPEQSKELAEEKAARDWREYWDEWRWWIGGVIIMNGIWGFQSISDGQPNNYWPMWPIGIWAVILVAMAFMPEDKDKDDED